MVPGSIDTEIRARVDAFVDELQDLIRRAALAAVKEVLGVAGRAQSARRKEPTPVRVIQPEPPPYELTPAAPPGRDAALPLRLTAYERAAYQRAIVESGGDLRAAAKLLGVSRSTVYRRTAVLGLPHDGGGAPVLVTDDPVSIGGYEKLALERALAETAGDVIAAARLLDVGKSTLYRKLGRHGLRA